MLLTGFDAPVERLIELGELIKLGEPHIADITQLALASTHERSASSHRSREELLFPTRCSRWAENRCMVLNIPDSLLREAGLTEEEALIEFACRLFQGERLTLWQAASLARLSRVQFEDQLLKRAIPIYRPTLDDFEEDLRTLRHLSR
jgi:predicted HTH domain antitoxin